jgi:hypothetical protein
MQKQKLLPGEQKYFLPNSETDLMKHYFSVCRRWQDTYRNIGKTNINMTNILRNNVSQFVPGSEAAEAFRKWRGIGQKGHFCIWPKSNDFMSFTSRTKIFENYGIPVHNVGNGFYRVFTTAKRALSFLQKRAFIQEILFSFCKWGTLAPQKGTFFTFFKKPLRFRGPCPGFKGYLYKLLGIFI